MFADAEAAFNLVPGLYRSRSNAGGRPPRDPFLTDDRAPLRTRVAAVILLLYAQPVSRITRLTIDDVIRSGDQVLLRLGDPPSPVRALFAALLRAHLGQGTADVELANGPRATRPEVHRPGSALADHRRPRGRRRRRGPVARHGHDHRGNGPAARHHGPGVMTKPERQGPVRVARRGRPAEVQPDPGSGARYPRSRLRMLFTTPHPGRLSFAAPVNEVSVDFRAHSLQRYQPPPPTGSGR